MELQEMKDKFAGKPVQFVGMTGKPNGPTGNQPPTILQGDTMTSIQQDQLQATAATDDDDYFHPIVLHYVKKALLTESAVLGTEVLALCGERWSADETDYAATADDQGDRRSVICPLCGDLGSILPSGV